jgi:hypothetical protein
MRMEALDRIESTRALTDEFDAKRAGKDRADPVSADVAGFFPLTWRFEGVLEAV